MLALAPAGLARALSDPRGCARSLPRRRRISLRRHIRSRWRRRSISRGASLFRQRREILLTRLQRSGVLGRSGHRMPMPQVSRHWRTQEIIVVTIKVAHYRPESGQKQTFYPSVVMSALHPIVLQNSLNAER